MRASNSRKGFSMKTPATERHEQHMSHMKSLTRRQDRRDYLAGLKKTEGAYYAKCVQQDFTNWWRNERGGNEQSQS